MWPSGTCFPSRDCARPILSLLPPNGAGRNPSWTVGWRDCRTAIPKCCGGTWPWPPTTWAGKWPVRLNRRTTRALPSNWKVLTKNLHISHSPRDVAELSLTRISAVIQAEGHAVWLDDNRDGRLFLIQGTLPFDEIGMARLIARFDGHDWPRPLVRNHVSGTLL